MKKIIYFAALALFSVSCMTEVQDKTAVESKETLLVSMGGPDTKIQLNDQVQTVWNKDDKVSVFYKNSNNEEWTFDGNTGDREGTISGKTTSAREMDEIVVVYPYVGGRSGGNSVYPDDKQVFTSFPATQTYQKGSYGRDANIMVASSTGGDLVLKNVFGWLKLDIIGTGTVKRIELTGNDDEILSGDILINYDNLEIEVPSNGSEGKSIVLECPDGVQLDSSTPTSFYIAVMPGKFTKGFKVNVSGDGDFHQQATQKQVVIERNKITKFSAFTYNKYNDAPSVEIKEVEAKRTAYDNYVTIKVRGYISYYAIAIPENYPMSLDDCKSAMVNDLEYGGMGKLMAENYEGSVWNITPDVASQGVPNTKKNHLLVLPIDGRDLDKYTVSDIEELEFATKSLGTDGSIDTEAVAIESGIDPYTQLGVQVTVPKSGWKYFYTAWMTEEQYESDTFGGNNDMVVDFLLRNSSPISPSMIDPKIVKKNITSGQTLYFVAVFVDENDNYGQAAKLKLTTKTLVRSEIKVSAETNLESEGDAMVLKNTTDLELTLTPSEEASKYKYVYFNAGFYNRYWDKTAADMADIILFAEVKDDVYEINASELADGNKLVIGEHQYNSLYYIAILPYDKDGNPGKEALMYEYNSVFELPEGTLITDSKSFVSEPEVSLDGIPEYIAYSDNIEASTYITFRDMGTLGMYFYYNIAYTVQPTDVEVLTMLVQPDEIRNMTDEQKASGLWAMTINSFQTKNGAGTYYRTLNGNDTNVLTPSILVSWKVGENYYYKEVSLDTEFKTMYDTLKAESR